jgi:competence protein ComEA
MRCLAFAIFTVGFAAIILSAAQDDGLPAGKGKDAFLKMCSNCHGFEQVTSHKYPKKYWANVVDDMISRGADGSDAEQNAVISYLSRSFGKPIDINTSSAKEIVDGLSFSAAEAQLLVGYRTDKGAFKTFEDLLKVPGLNADLLEEQKKNILF